MYSCTNVLLVNVEVETVVHEVQGRPRSVETVDLRRGITYQELSFDEDRIAMIRAGVPQAIGEMNAQAFSLTAEGDAEWRHP